MRYDDKEADVFTSSSPALSHRSSKAIPWLPPGKMIYTPLPIIIQETDSQQLKYYSTHKSKYPTEQPTDQPHPRCAPHQCPLLPHALLWVHRSNPQILNSTTAAANRPSTHTHPNPDILSSCVTNHYLALHGTPHKPPANPPMIYTLPNPCNYRTIYILYQTRVTTVRYIFKATTATGGTATISSNAPLPAGRCLLRAPCLSKNSSTVHTIT